ncbi:MAG: hypothetical protein QGF74_01085 [Candidatus Nanoarchaeia archaeon]|jgi:hypothetical protein|nr:hypothetical protein [Candidatus Nanoarchaeia archaeon]|tara:strand:- start:451 stop:720 length:270 start_codon:yes stop_codon:yes gene_type:complete
MGLGQYLARGVVHTGVPAAGVSLALCYAPELANQVKELANIAQCSPGVIPGLKECAIDLGTFGGLAALTNEARRWSGRALEGAINLYNA